MFFRSKPLILQLQTTKQIVKMPKSKTKNYDLSRAAAINWVADTHVVTREYVRAAVSGNRTGGRTDELVRDFKKKYAELKKVLA